MVLENYYFSFFSCDFSQTDGVLREDSGKFTNMSALPVMELSGKLSQTPIYAAFDVGHLMCTSVGKLIIWGT